MASSVINPLPVIGDKIYTERKIISDATNKSLIVRYGSKKYPILVMSSGNNHPVFGMLTGTSGFSGYGSPTISGQTDSQLKITFSDYAGPVEFMSLSPFTVSDPTT